MARKPKYVPPQWTTANHTAEGEIWTPVCISLLEWPADKRPSLSYGERLLYLCMVEEAKGQKSFEFPRHVAAKYGFPWSTAHPAIKSLVEAGLIRKTEQGGGAWGKNSYEFSNDWKAKWWSRP